jgi:predicted RND superfamily exporter protein
MSVNPTQKLNDRQATDAFIAEVAASAPNAAGRSVVEWGIGAVVVEAFQQATAMAFATIFLLLLLYFRNWIFPLLVLTPIAMTVVLTFAVCVLLGISLNMANILMVPLILGLGVDTGIHMVHRYRQAQAGAEAMDPAIRRAVLISGLTTIGTFCSLSLSPHQGAASIGLLLTVAISLLLVISLVLLPVLLNWFAPARS